MPLWLGGLAFTFAGAFAANGQWPLLMTHESSSYYFDHQEHGYQGLSSVQSPAYTVDQVLSLRESLDVGVRAFDIRPQASRRGKVILHHGALWIRADLDSLFQEVSDWRSAEADTRKDELIVIFLQFEDIFPWLSALLGTSAGSTTSRGDAFNLARKRGWQIFSDTFRDLDYSQSFRPCSVFSGLLRNGTRLNGTVVIDETCINSQYDKTIHCDNGDLALGMFSGWLYPLKCGTRHDHLLINHMNRVVRDPEVGVDTPRFIQAHFQGMRLVRAEESRQVNRRIIVPWLKSNADILKNQPIFIQVDRITPKSAKCLVGAIKRIQYAGCSSAKSWETVPCAQSAFEVDEQCDSSHDNTRTMVGDESVIYDEIPVVVYGTTPLLAITFCICARILSLIAARTKARRLPVQEHGICLV